MRFVFYVDISCEWIGENVICIYSCKSGYVYYDGIIFKDYYCLGENNWFFLVNFEECLCKYILV